MNQAEANAALQMALATPDRAARAMVKLLDEKERLEDIIGEAKGILTDMMYLADSPERDAAIGRALRWLEARDR